MSRALTLVEKRLERLEIELKRSKQIESKPRLIIPDGGGDDHFLFYMLENMGLASGLAEIRTPDDSSQVAASASVVNTLGDFSHLLNEDAGVCFRVDGVYYAIHPESPVGGGGTAAGKGHVFTLTSNLTGSVAATATATVTVSGESGVVATDAITVYNTGTKKAFTGAAGFAVKIGSQYWVVEIDQYPILSLVELNADTHTFSPASTVQGKIADQDTVSVSSFVSLTPYPFSFVPSPFPTITNPYNLIGLSGDQAIVQYNEDADEFQLLEVLPANKRRIRFKLSADMSTEVISSTTDFTVLEACEYTSGEVEVPTTIYDPMSLVVNGGTDDEGVAEYSYRNSVWQIVSFRKRDVAGSILALTGSSIAARSGTTISSGSCTEYKIVAGVLTTNTNSVTIHNPWPVAIPGSYYITAVKEKVTGFWIAQFPGVVDVNWNSPDLRQTLDGTNYTTIDTATACP